MGLLTIIRSAASNPDVTVPLVGASSSSAHGLVALTMDRAVSGLDAASAGGLLGVLLDRAMVGVASDGLAGLLAPTTDHDLTGLELLGSAGTLDHESASVLLGGLVSSATGTVLPPGGGDPGTEYIEFQRQRRFGRRTTPLARQPYPRRMR